MRKITMNIIQEVYAQAKAFNEGQRNLSSILQYFNKNFDMEETSMADYIYVFKHMMEGTEYQRTINKEATEYYLENIYKDFGVNQLQKATHALSLHIEYYESLQNSTMITQRNLLERFRKIADTTDAWEDPDELGDSPSFSEGAKKNITVNSYERDPNARAHCLQHYGYTCKVCGMDFESTYGILGKNFIHVHHLIPLSDIGNGYETNPIEDLIPICPNCHAMIHKMDHTTADSIDELRFIIKIHRSSNTKQDD